MTLFKNFILSIVASISFASGEGDGWFPVEKKTPVEEESLERDPAIWVLFSKTIDSETILLRFPEDPIYHKTETGDLLVRSERNGEIFELVVSEKMETDPTPADRLYELEGAWIHEHVIQTENHTYHLKTLSNQMDSPNHKDFIASFAAQ